MKSHHLMKLLIPDGDVKDVARFTGLNSSLLYQERRRSGKQLNDTGTRNTIDRLDLFCEFVLDTNPQVVQIVGERYLNMYRNYVEPLPTHLTLQDLLKELGEVARECGEAMAALSQCKSLKDCIVEVTEAKNKLEHTLRMVEVILSNQGD